MSARPTKLVVPLAHQQKQAAQALGVSDELFVREIRPHLRCVYVGSVRIWAVSELQAWLDANGSRPHDGPHTSKRPRAAGTAGGMAHEESAS
jgi:hypothetical protein